MPCSNPSVPSVKQIWKFEITDKPLNNGTLSISDELIDTEAIATERAASEFLRTAYTENSISFSTPRSDLAINDEISIESKLYKVKNISIAMNGVSTIYTITAVRYD